ncbi:MAG: amino acid ABC transporter substrate-binding protein [Desulfobacteraceae bacterium]|nr:amino acid ABC transporter substrate-binding protein [Desulfobacteraceae bacterium]
MLKKMNIPYETSLSTPNDFKKLAAGRVDIICAIEDVGDGLINLYPDKYKNVEKILPSLKNKPYYLMLSKQFSGSNPDLAELLWDTLAEVRDSEELQQIKLKY